MFKKIATLVSAFVMGTTILTGCGSGDSASGKLDKVTIAEVTHSVFYAPQYAAISKGFFEEEGIQIDTINTQGADKTMAALISEEANIGLMGPEASIYVHSKDKDDYAVNFAQLTKRDGSFLMAREKMPDFKYEDLKGKEILGGRKGGMPLMTFEYVLKDKGLTIGENTENGDVNLRTDVQFGVMAGAFAGGEGDFTTAFEPTATAMEKEGTGYIVASIGKDSGEIPFTAYSATQSYIKDNPELIQRFTNAVYKGQLWVQEASDKEIADAIKPFFEDITVEDLTTVVNRYKSIDAWSADPVLKEESLDKLVSVMKEAGELDKDVSYKDLVNTDFANTAIKEVK